MKKFMLDMEVFPAVAELLHFYAGLEVGKNDLAYLICGGGYNRMTDEEKAQFIRYLEQDGQDTSWLPYRTEAERLELFKKREYEKNGGKEKKVFKFKRRDA